MDYVVLYSSRVWMVSRCGLPRLVLANHYFYCGMGYRSLVDKALRNVFAALKSTNSSTAWVHQTSRNRAGVKLSVGGFIGTLLSGSS